MSLSINLRGNLSKCTVCMKIISRLCIYKTNTTLYYFCVICLKNNTSLQEKKNGMGAVQVRIVDFSFKRLRTTRRRPRNRHIHIVTVSVNIVFPRRDVCALTIDDWLDVASTAILPTDQLHTRM